MADELNKETQNKTTDNINKQASPGGASTKASKENSSESSGTIDTDAIKETAKGLYDQAKSTAGQAYGVAAEKATAKLDEKKSDLASGLSSVAETIRQIGGNLRQTDEQTGITDTAAQYGDSLAQQVEYLSNYFERNDVREMLRDLESFARRNPAVFLGGAFAVGLLAARFLKSTPTNQSNRRLAGRSGKSAPQGLLTSGNETTGSNKNNSPNNKANSKSKDSENASGISDNAVPNPS